MSPGPGCVVWGPVRSPNQLESWENRTDESSDSIGGKAGNTSRTETCWTAWKGESYGESKVTRGESGRISQGTCTVTFASSDDAKKNGTPPMVTR